MKLLHLFILFVFVVLLNFLHKFLKEGFKEGIDTKVSLKNIKNNKYVNIYKTRLDDQFTSYTTYYLQVSAKNQTYIMDDKKRYLYLDKNLNIKTTFISPIYDIINYYGYITTLDVSSGQNKDYNGTYIICNKYAKLLATDNSDSTKIKWQILAYHSGAPTKVESI
jgi:hypothetical protein